MNLQRIERLKGLLARVELNAKKPRLRPAMALATRDDIACDIAPSAVSLPPVSLSSGDLEIEDVALDDFAVELSPAPVAVTPVAAESTEAPVVALEDVSAEDIGLEDISVEVTTEEPPGVTASAPIQTSIEASPKPFTLTPALEELTFSEPPPARLPSKLPPLSGAMDLEPEAPPASSRQPISEAPDSIDAALLAAAQADAEEREAPLLTPPPESGKQPTSSSKAELSAESTAYRQAAPTVEQLGDVIELEELPGPSLELAEAAPVELKSEPEELEFIPSKRPPELVPGTREPMATLVGVSPEELPPSSRQAAAESTAAAAVLRPERTERRPSTPSAPVIQVIAQAQAFRPRSFLELLDASLKLGKR